MARPGARKVAPDPLYSLAFAPFVDDNSPVRAAGWPGVAQRGKCSQQLRSTAKLLRTSRAAAPTNCLAGPDKQSPVRPKTFCAHRGGALGARKHQLTYGITYVFSTWGFGGRPGGSGVCRGRRRIFFNIPVRVEYFLGRRNEEWKDPSAMPKSPGAGNISNPIG